MSLKNFILILLFASSAQFGISPAYAQSACSEIFLKGTNAPTYESLPKLLEQPLPQEMVDIIHKHPLYAKTRPYADKEITLATNLFRDGKMSIIAKGEAIQSSLVGKILKVLFPKAHPGPMNTPDALDISPLDRAESGAFPVEANFLSMPLLKPANPTGSRIDRVALRQQFHIPENAHIISLYLRTPDTFNLAEAKRVISEINQKWPIDVVFINYGLHSPLKPGYSPDNHFPSLGTRDVKAFSKLNRFSFLNSPKIVITNDMQGYLPYAHALSDVAVVVGPINFMEPLTVGTPTVIYANSSTNRSYNEKVFEDLVQIAKQTGGAQHVQNKEDITTEVLTFVNNPPAITPPYMVSINGKTPVDHLMDSLQAWLIYKRVIEP